MEVCVMDIQEKSKNNRQHIRRLTSIVYRDVKENSKYNSKQLTVTVSRYILNKIIIWEHLTFDKGLRNPNIKWSNKSELRADIQKFE